MENKEKLYRDYPQGQVAPGLSDAEEFFSKSLELTEWYDSGLSTTGSFDVGIMVASPFGKLLDALPVPAMMIDSSYKVAFANQACGTISNSYKIIQGVPFASLVPRPRNSEKALEVLKKVLLARKSVIAEGILEIDARKVWGRLYFRPIRIGAERYVLLVIADLTKEKTSLLMKHRRTHERTS
jgi:two-component system, cell cycle sensor histidine kinase and response regulator CckA